MNMTTSFKKSRLESFTIILILMILLSLSTYSFYNHEMKNKPIVKERMLSGDFSYLFDFYIVRVPKVDGRPFLGSQDAGINLIAYINSNSESSKHFINNIFPQLKLNYIDTGLVKFYIKNPLTLKDFNKKNENFIYAKSLVCISQINGSAYYPFYFDLYNIENIREINGLLSKHNISDSDYNTCMENEKFNALMEDISETENLGLNSINARFYIGISGTDYKKMYGIPKYIKFNRTIRDYEVIIGN